MSGPPYIGCRWTFTDASGSGYVNLGEVRFFDAAGDFLDVITTVANPGGTPGGDYNAERVIDGITRSNSKCWRDTSFVSGSNPSTLAVNFSSAITIAAYDLYTGGTDASCPQTGYPTAWTLECSTDYATWAVVDNRSGVVVPTAYATSYGWEAREAAFALAGTYPQYGTASYGTALSTCKFVFTATSGGTYPNVDEIRLYDAAGDLMVGALQAAENPGGNQQHTTNYAASKVVDGVTRSNQRCWHDLNAEAVNMTSTLVLNFSSALTFAAYDLYTGGTDGSCPQTGYPTAWKMLCKESYSDPYWSILDSRSGVVVPTAYATSYGWEAREAAFALTGTYPQYAAIAVGSNVSMCKWVFQATSGGTFPNVGDLEVYDVAGAELGIVRSRIPEGHNQRSLLVATHVFTPERPFACNRCSRNG